MFRTTSAAILVTAITLSACTGSEAAPTTTTADPVTPTVAPTTTTTQSPTTTQPEPTTTTLQDGAVGSREALLEAMQPLVDATSSIYGIGSDDVPIPALNDLDPVTSAGELLMFEVWLLENSTLEEWADVVAVRNSQAWGRYSSGFDALGGRTAAFGNTTQPFTISEIRLATASEIDVVPPGELDGAGTDGVVVYFRTSLAAHQISDPDEPSLTEGREGWTDRAELGVLVPTKVGWQWFWQGEL